MKKLNFFSKKRRELTLLAGFYNAKCYYHLSKYKEARERFEQIISYWSIETLTEGEEKKIEFEITAEEIFAECIWYIGLSLYYENKNIKKHFNKIIEYLNTALECFQKNAK